MILEIGRDHVAFLETESRGALPRECCGLIEGLRAPDRLQVTALHAARNLSEDLDSFEIDPAVQFRVLRGLRGTGRAIIGCYHSHPDGPDAPSARDSAGASEDGFLWLIVGMAGGNIRYGAYLWSGRRFLPIQAVETL